MNQSQNPIPQPENPTPGVTPGVVPGTGGHNKKINWKHLIFGVIGVVLLFEASLYFLVRSGLFSKGFGENDFRLAPATTPALNTASPTPSQFDGLTASWQTYRNEEFGFEFRYPKEWILEGSSAEIVSLNSPERLADAEDSGMLVDVVGIRVVYVPHTDTSEFSEFIAKFDAGYYTNFQANQIFVHNKYAELFKTTSESEQDVFIDFNEKYIISIFFKADRAQEIDIFDQILSTFRFIDFLEIREKNCINSGGKYIGGPPEGWMDYKNMEIWIPCECPEGTQWSFSPEYKCKADTSTWQTYPSTSSGQAADVSNRKLYRRFVQTKSVVLI